MAVFDLENTLIFNEFLPELAATIGRGAEVAHVTRQGVNGEIDWAQGFVLRSKMLRGIPRAQVAAMAKNLRCVPGAWGFVRGLKARGAGIVLITGGPQEVAFQAQRKFGADQVFSNEFLYENGHLTGEVRVHVTPELKGSIVTDLIRARGLKRREVMAAADGLMDLHLLRAAGIRLGINSHGRLRGIVDYEAADFHDAFEWLLRRGHI
jgi:phosphoserine phosphatase